MSKSFHVHAVCSATAAEDAQAETVAQGADALRENGGGFGDEDVACIEVLNLLVGGVGVETEQAEASGGMRLRHRLQRGFEHLGMDAIDREADRRPGRLRVDPLYGGA